MSYNFKKVGLWVPCEGPNRLLEDDRGIKHILRCVEKLKVTDIFLQVFRSGKTWFTSETFESKESKLSELMAALKGKRVHAWVNVCNAGLDPSEKFLKNLGGKKAMLEDGQGRTTGRDLSPFEIDTPGIWLEPSNPELTSALQSLASEINSLEFSGIHLDFIRYPYCIPTKPASWIDCGVDFGYSKTALQRFGQLETKSSKLNGVVPANEAVGQKFDAWRRDQITTLVTLFRNNLAEEKRLSIAALAWSDRAYLNAFQDWRIWMLGRLVDDLCLMSYTGDLNLLFEQIQQTKAFASGGQGIFAGIGLYKLESQEELKQQLHIIESLDASPCYFCAERLLLPPFASLLTI